MREQDIQTKILGYLKKRGIYAIKVIMASASGVPDIIGMLPGGRFFAIEVKAPNGKLSALQVLNLERIQLNGGIAIIARSVDDVAKHLDI